MNKAQRIVLRGGLSAVVLVNLFYASGINYVSNGVQHVVASDVVSVYTPSESSTTATVPVQTLAGKPPDVHFAATGQRVAVYLRNNYCASEGSARPTLMLLAVAWLLFWFAGRSKAN